MFPSVVVVAGSRRVQLSYISRPTVPCYVMSVEGLNLVTG